MPFRNFRSGAFLFLAGWLLQAPWATANPDDTGFSAQWGLLNPGGADIGYVQAMEMVQNQPKAPVVVAVIDSAMDITNPDLRDRLWRNPDEIEDGIDNDGNGLVDDIHGWDFINNNPSVMSYLMPHATAVAGLVAAEANNNYSVAGVAGMFPVRIMPLQVLNLSDFLSNSCQMGDGQSGFQRSVELTQAALDALEYAIDKGADVINVSLGAVLPQPDNAEQRDVIAMLEEKLQSLMNRAEQRGIPIVVAAGNSNNRYYSHPEDDSRLLMDMIVPKIRLVDVENNNGEVIQGCELVRENDELVYELQEGLEPSIPMAMARSHPNIIGVASINKSGELASWRRSEFLEGEPQQADDHSGYGAHILMAAPGVEVRSVRPFFELNLLLTLTGNNKGTSFAAPMVTGAIATMMSLQPELKPDHESTDWAAAKVRISRLRELLTAGVIKTPELQGAEPAYQTSLVSSGGYLDLPGLYQQMGY